MKRRNFVSIPKDAVKKKPNVRLNELAKQVEQLGEAQVSVLASHFPKMIARIQDLERNQVLKEIEAKLAEPPRWPRFVVVLALATYCLALTLYPPVQRSEFRVAPAPIHAAALHGYSIVQRWEPGDPCWEGMYWLDGNCVPIRAQSTITSATTSPLADDGYLVQSHKFIVSAPEGCWVGAGSDGEAAKKQAPQYIALAAETLVVRDGCPGKATFVVDGKEVHPENRATNKKTVELVTLP